MYSKFLTGASAFYRHPLLPQLKGYKNRETLNLRIEDKRKTAATSLYLSQFEFNLNNDVAHSGRKYNTILCLCNKFLQLMKYSSLR